MTALYSIDITAESFREALLLQVEDLDESDLDGVTVEELESAIKEMDEDRIESLFNLHFDPSEIEPADNILVDAERYNAIRGIKTILEEVQGR